MKTTPRVFASKRWIRFVVFLFACLPVILLLIVGLVIGQGGRLSDAVFRTLHPSAKTNIQEKIDKHSTEVVSIAQAIRHLTDNPQERAAVVDSRVLCLIEYTPNTEVWGDGYYVPSVAEMERKRIENNWPFWRGDCKSQAVLAASVLDALGLSYEIETSTIQAHAWVSVFIAGQHFEINALHQRNQLPSPKVADVHAYTHGDAATKAALETVGLVHRNGDTYAFDVLPALKDRDSLKQRACEAGESV